MRILDNFGGLMTVDSNVSSMFWRVRSKFRCEIWPSAAVSSDWPWQLETIGLHRGGDHLTFGDAAGSSFAHDSERLTAVAWPNYFQNHDVSSQARCISWSWCACEVNPTSQTIPRSFQLLMNWLCKNRWSWWCAKTDQVASADEIAEENPGSVKLWEVMPYRQPPFLGKSLRAWTIGFEWRLAYHGAWQQHTQINKPRYPSKPSLKTLYSRRQSKGHHSTLHLVGW